jgi:predicted DCC family thiol-disulfide oxidoreductase YuxK|tara:strand:+ start:354 stop:2261 length:1908 start_codon:yes stop_codon:yes gene_type:complete
MIINNLLDKFIQKSAFPKVISFENELMKMGILRILLGIVIFIRYAEMSQSLELLEYSTKAIFISYSLLGLIICFIIGFYTPLVTLLILCVVIRCEFGFGTYTLGTSILQVSLIPFILINSGQYYSLDRLFLKGNSVIAKPIKFMFKFLGSANEITITRAYFITFIIYAVISFAALTYHIQDGFWVQGITTKALLINSFLSKHYSFFRIIEENIPYLLSALSILSSVFQSIFQFLMIPLIYFILGRKFVLLYGLTFFLISLFFINLSYLPHVEIILWLMILLPIKKSENNLEIFYDDHCNLCKRTMIFFKLINFNQRFIFSPISLNTSRVTKFGLSQKEIKSYMAGTHKGNLFIGYDLYIKICLVNPLLFLFIPLLFLGKVTAIGPLIYNLIAERRYKYFGICEISFNDEISQKSIPLQLPTYQFPNNFLVTSYSVLFFLYIVFNPNLGNIAMHIPLAPKVRPHVMKALIYSGFVLPNVFNKTDLSMGDCWMEVYRLENDQLYLIPITGKEGERLTYNNFDVLNFTNYNSDVLYYGTTLPFRRKSISTDTKENMEENCFGWESLMKRLSYDYSFNGFNEEKRYLVRIYRNHQGEVTLNKMDHKKFEKSLEFENWYLYNNKTMTLISKNNKQIPIKL